MSSIFFIFQNIPVLGDQNVSKPVQFIYPVAHIIHACQWLALG